MDLSNAFDYILQELKDDNRMYKIGKFGEKQINWKNKVNKKIKLAKLKMMKEV